MALNNNSSRLYVVKETTSGTLKAPSAGSEALALQPGFEFTPNVDTQQNEELRASIGPSKPIVGIERPEATFSHYLRNSGSQGVTPDFHLLLESLFGSTSTNSTERATTTSSTSTVLKLAAGGSDFALGKAVLIKDGANGYSIRPVDSVSTNDLTLGFALSVSAPGTGISVGKCVNYTPVNSGHPTLSLWLFRANGGDIEAEAGALVTNMALSVEVGQLINMAFTASGTKFFFNPIIITSTNKYIDITTDNVTDDPATIPEGAYQTPLQLATAIAAALNAADPLETFTCTYSSVTGKFTIATTTSTLFSLLWNTGANTANSAKTILGFSNTDDTGSTSYASDTAQSYADLQTPSLDSSDPIVAKDNEVLVGDRSDFVSMCVQTMNATIGLETEDVLCIKSTSGVDSKVVRRRNTSIEITAVLEKYDADKFDRFIQNTTTKFCFNFGVKSGGNWVAGRCGSLYVPQATISAFRVGDNNGIVTMVFTVSPYVDSSGNPEVYMNLL